MDYIGYTAMSLEQCLIGMILLTFNETRSVFPFFSEDHRRNGNRIMHEFILGERNIRRVQPEDTSPQ